MAKISISIANTLRNEIIEQKLAGKEFLSESELAARFGVSKGPIKEAMHILCKEGLLVGYPRRGYMVNTYSAEDYQQVMQLRRCIEKMCIVLTVQNAADEDLRQLKEKLKGQVDAEDKSPLKSNNTEFHLRLAELSGNKFAVSVLKTLLDISAIGSIKMPTDNSIHEKILDAAINRDVDEAVRLLEEDIQC